MLRIVCILLLAIIVLPSCNKSVSNPFCSTTTMVGSEDKYEELSSELIIYGDTLPAVCDLIIVGDYLVVNIDDNNARLQFFSLTGDRLGTYGKKGHADNEFTEGLRLVDQPSEHRLYLNDVNKGMFVVVDVDSIVKNGNLKPVQIFKGFSRVLNVFYKGDSEVVYEQEIPGSYALSLRDMNSGSEIWQEPLYDPIEHPFLNYYSFITFNEEQQKLASAMCYANQVNFMSLDTKSRKTNVVRIPSQSDSYTDGFNYYCSIASNDKYILALFMNQNVQDCYSKEKTMEIHVFDWDGNFINKFKVKEYIFKIAVDNNNNIYGSDGNGNIYKYTFGDKVKTA